MKSQINNEGTMMNNPNAADNLILMKPGETRNPNGRPKGSKSMSTILKKLINVSINNPKLLDQYEALFPEYFNGDKKGKKPKQLIMLRLMTKALEGDSKSIDMIFDRTEGKVKEQIDQTIEVVTTESDVKKELEELKKKLLKDKQKKGGGKYGK